MIERFDTIDVSDAGSLTPLSQTRASRDRGHIESWFVNAMCAQRNVLPDGIQWSGALLTLSRRPVLRIVPSLRVPFNLSRR
jgi:hypothetical protein